MCIVYDSLTCSISIALHGTGNTWKMDINGHGKSWKTTFIILYTPCVNLGTAFFPFIRWCAAQSESSTCLSFSQFHDVDGLMLTD